MLTTVIEDIIRHQRPYYQPQGSAIRGLNNQYWLVFRHRDADNFLKSVVTFLGMGKKESPYKLLRVDPQQAKVYEYIPRKDDDLPSNALLRTASLSILEKFLKQVSQATEKTLQAASLRSIRGKKRKYQLPNDLVPYNQYVNEALSRSVLYRRSTAYFDSGVLKLYEEPLQQIIAQEGQIRLLMDWQGFTKTRDIQALAQLENPTYRAEFAKRSLQDFLQGLASQAFNSTQIMAELVRLGFLQIKLIKMQGGRSLYHKKTGILTDALGNSLLHEGSDNFTRAAHGMNSESVIFLYSWEALDAETIQESIEQFDTEWSKDDLSFDLSQEFLAQVLQERERRTAQRPRIDTISPDEFPAGETTPFEATGENLDQVDKIDVPDNTLVDINIQDKTPDRLTGKVTVSPDHPQRPIKDFRVRDSGNTPYHIRPKQPVQVTQTDTLPAFDEIEGYRPAIQQILSGQHGKPEDFQYWLAQQRPQQIRVESSDLLEELVNQTILFEHQKSGAQHCLRVMQDFGVAVCADAVGLGKTRLAAAAARLYRQDLPNAKIAVVAARKLHPNWEREFSELGFRRGEYELYNKNLMSRKQSNFIDDFNRYGGPDLVIIDEAHEGIRNYKSRIHRLCEQIKARDKEDGRQRHFLLLTATPWNNRREDIYNILNPFITRPEGFQELGFPPEVANWFQNREIGKEPFTDNSELFRRTYRELFLQRTRKMLRAATPDLNLYAKRQAEWLSVEFEPGTEQALEQIFSQFETELYIPFADPVRYLTGSIEQRGLLQNQRRFFLQRAESSMYALRRTIVNFRDRIVQMQAKLQAVSADADGLLEFLLSHYGFEKQGFEKQAFENDLDSEMESDRDIWDEDYLEPEDDEADTEDENESARQEKRQQLRRTIEKAIERLQADPLEARRIYDHLWSACDSDLMQLDEISQLLAAEFVTDHKREQVTQKVRELVGSGQKVLLISTFSDTVLDYYRYMAQDSAIAAKGIGMAIGATKRYFPADGVSSPTIYRPHNLTKGAQERKSLKRQTLFRAFAPAATCRNPADRPQPHEQLQVLIGSETLSVGQNLQDADYLINIDLPWNPMMLEQRIGRIDRPKQRPTDYIYIYYANSESQLLRQASRLNNLHKKLLGEVPTEAGEIPTQGINAETLGASVYGDTLFDDEVLPGYVDFLNSLIKARKLEQGNLQEDIYQRQETHRDLYTQHELLHNEELRKLLDKLGPDYPANPIALGRYIGEPNEPKGLLGLTVQYYGPNQELIDEKTEVLFWNDQTQRQDGYGIAIATAFKTPEAGNIFSNKHLIKLSQSLYNQLLTFKQQLAADLDRPETLGNINLSSERITQIRSRIMAMETLPEGLDAESVRAALKKLSSQQGLKTVQNLLRKFTEGKASELDDIAYVTELVTEAEKLSLLDFNAIKPVSLKLSVAAMLIRA